MMRQTEQNGQSRVYGVATVLTIQDKQYNSNTTLMYLNYTACPE